MEVNLKALGALAENILQEARKAREERARGREAPGKSKQTIEEVDELRGQLSREVRETERPKMGE